MDDKRKKLEELFKEFPGIGPRQAKRFVYFLLWKDFDYLNELSNNIKNIKEGVIKCQKCNAFFNKVDEKNICNICSNPHRNQKKIMILEKNPDLDNIENMNIWDGRYYILGKKLKISEINQKNWIDLSKLFSEIKNNNIKEIVFALSLNPEGEYTMDWIKEQLYPLKKEFGFKITELARGISLGTDLEYSDKITLEEALNNRKEK